MRKMTVLWSLGIAAVLAVGCAKSATPAAEPANAGTEEPPVAETEQVTCHLECSGTHATGTGATEEEAREDVGQHIEANCKPEDGQYFIFCDPPQ
jgi:hypothetical protein